MSTLDFKGRALAAFLAVSSIAPLALAPAQPAFAESIQVTEKGVEHGDALHNAETQAQNFSLKNNGVGIVINYGSAPGSLTAEQIGDKFVGWFAESGIRANYFVVNSDVPGASMAFAVGKVFTDVYNPLEAKARISEVISLRQGASSIASSMALDHN